MCRTQTQDEQHYKSYKENDSRLRELPRAVLPIANEEKRKNESKYTHVIVSEASDKAYHV